MVVLVAQDEQKFQKLKKEVQRDLWQEYWAEIVTPQESDPNAFSSMKRFWKFIKHRAADFNGVAPLKVDDKLVTDSKLKAEALNSQFQAVFTRETDFLPSSTSPRAPPMDKIDITEAGVLNLLKNLNPGKAPGPDSISPRVLKELSDVIAGPLTLCLLYTSPSPRD